MTIPYEKNTAILDHIISSAWTPDWADWAPDAIDDGLQSFETCGADVNVQFSNVLLATYNTHLEQKKAAPWCGAWYPPIWYTTLQVYASVCFCQT